MINLLRTRRSIRKFQSTAINPATIEILKETLLRAPSSHGKNPCEFIFVNNQATLKVLSQSKANGAEFLEHTPLGIVICGNETISDVWVEDCSIAAILLQMVSHAEGLGSCWVQIRNRNNKNGISAEQFIQDLLGIPQHLRVLAIIGVGIPAEAKKGIQSDQLNFDKIHFNTYST